MGFIDYLRLMRFNFHISFITVVLGALLYSSSINFQLLKSLFLCYVFFNVSLYGGIYALNGIVDLESDSKDRIKKFRPMPSKKISVKSAMIFSLTLIILGLYLSLNYLSKNIFLIFLTFLLLNLFYNFISKKIIYLNLLTVSSTHTLRLFLGMTIAGAKSDMLFLAAFYSIVFGISVTIHSMFNKKPHEERFYAKKPVFYMQLSCLLIALAMFFYNETFSIPWIIAISFYSLLFSCSKIDALRPYIARLFMIKLKA